MLILRQGADHSLLIFERLLWVGSPADGAENFRVSFFVRRH